MNSVTAILKPMPSGEAPAGKGASAAPPDLVHPRPWLVVGTLLQREFVRFIRQKHRVFGALGQPLIFLILFGAGLHGSFRNPVIASEHTYFEYFFPGALILILLFTAIFATISIIEDRREGFLLSMLVSPAPRTSMVLGKILGSATLAWLQGLIFLAFAPLAGVRIGLVELVPVIAAIFLISFTLTGLGFVIAWKMESTSGFHAIMNLLLVPMWMVSGSLFPMATAHGVIRAIMWVNPLTYSISLLNYTLRLPNATPGPIESVAVTAAFGLVLLLASGVMAAQKATRSAA